MRIIDADAVCERCRKSGSICTGKDCEIPSAPTLTQPNEPLPVLVNDEPDREYIDYICPRCKNTISQRRRGQRMETVYQCKFHDNCGQRVDWSDPRPYRRPPEGEKET